MFEVWIEHEPFLCVFSEFPKTQFAFYLLQTKKNNFSKKKQNYTDVHSLLLVDNMFLQQLLFFAFVFCFLDIFEQLTSYISLAVMFLRRNKNKEKKKVVAMDFLLLMLK
jgi:hypothetical protein